MHAHGAMRSSSGEPVSKQKRHVDALALSPSSSSVPHDGTSVIALFLFCNYSYDACVMSVKI